MRTAQIYVKSLWLQRIFWYSFVPNKKTCLWLARLILESLHRFETIKRNDALTIFFISITLTLIEVKISLRIAKQYRTLGDANELTVQDRFRIHT